MAWCREDGARGPSWRRVSGCGNRGTSRRCCNGPKRKWSSGSRNAAVCGGQALRGSELEAHALYEGYGLRGGGDPPLPYAQAGAQGAEEAMLPPTGRVRGRVTLAVGVAAHYAAPEALERLQTQEPLVYYLEVGAVCTAPPQRKLR